jgi:integrase
VSYVGWLQRNRVALVDALDGVRTACGLPHHPADRLRRRGLEPCDLHPTWSGTPNAMHLLQAGNGPIIIRDILGHADVRTTEVYARVDWKPNGAHLKR